MKKLIALLLALAMVLTLGACGNTDANTSSDSQVSTPVDSSTPESKTPVDDEVEPTSYQDLDWDAIDAMDYEDASDAIYDHNLGEFYEYYKVAKQELDDIDLRTALMALAEAKMLESGVFAPIYGDGGNYAISRVVPRTATTTSWGLDEYKWYTTLVANEILTTEDRNAIIGIWTEAADADAFFADARAYLDEHGYTLTDTWNTYSGYDMETWDIIATSYTSDSYFIACTVGGLLEYDVKNNQQPSLATSYEVSEDGLVYTFHIREGVNWVDQQGRVIAPVTANDWVTSMMHVADNNDALGYLMTSTDGCGIKNYDAYISGECTFEDVGVKALDDYTLEYTLEAKFPAFDTMMGYGCFAPLNYDFYKSQGGTFGAEGDEYTPGNYGTGPDTIAYCGPYLVTNYTPQNIWSFAANPEFWNPDAINVHNVNFYYNDGTDVLRIYNSVKDGTWAGGGLNANAVTLAQEEIPEGETETYFDLYNYTTTNSATTYCAWLNINRAIFHDFNDETSGVSPKSEDDAARTRSAMNNQHFRLALAYGFDRGSYNAVSVGEDLKYAALKNSYVTGSFAQMKNAVTVDINGTSTTFPAGTYYGEIMQAQLDADGYPIKVWDPTADGGAGSGDGFDGWYNVENARAELQKAIDELAQAGIEISAENPIYIDSFYFKGSETNTNTKQAYKQGIESALEGKVIVNLVGYDDSTQMQYAYYRNSTGAEANFDISHSSGWGPDYGDPQTFLDTIQPFGYMCKNIGIY
ncbi:MAG: peptide ABC transporter substrate-binding protein [Acutalibacter sp.]|nr:peptide ABC transporter substrate-binding protein [Acutalibacter sp.]